MATSHQTSQPGPATTPTSAQTATTTTRGRSTTTPPPVAAPNLTGDISDQARPSSPSTPPRSTPPRSTPRTARQLREAVVQRLPELLGGAGAMLVVAAVAGFVVSSWDVLGNVGQASLLAAGSVLPSLNWSRARPTRVRRASSGSRWATPWLPSSGC